MYRQQILRPLQTICHRRLLNAYETAAMQSFMCSNVSYLNWTEVNTLSHNEILHTCRRGFHSTLCYHAGNVKHDKKFQEKINKLIKVTERKRKRNKAAIYERMTIQSLADELGVSYEAVVAVMSQLKIPKSMFKQIQPNSKLSSIELIKQISKSFGVTVFTIRSGPTAQKLKEEEKRIKDLIKPEPPSLEKMVSCPPVVTIMGHVDHGKTSLLDALRKSNIVDKEFGGITQHIGAFSVSLASGHQITFLDTPGHAAFSSMRARGAVVTDIVVLVVAADDGIMPQTIESIQHARKAGVPIVVAINKIDVPNADIDRVIKGLMEQGVTLEDYGGDTQWVPISAKNGTNLQELQEKIVTLAEVLDVKCDPNGMVEGYILESKQDHARGSLATVLVKRGTLKNGKIIVAGTTYAKVKGMQNERGEAVKKVSPAHPVEVLGWKEVPSAGDEVLEASTERIAKDVVDFRLSQLQSKKQEEDAEIIKVKQMEDREVHNEKRKQIMHLGKKIFKKSYVRAKEDIIGKDMESPNLSVVIKGDVSGSIDAILNTLATYDSQKCRLDIMDFDVGNITEADISLAQDFNGAVLGFNVTASKEVLKKAEEVGVSVKMNNVIYKLFDDVIEMLNERLPLIEEEEIVGEAEVLKPFSVAVNKSKQVNVGGCVCNKGTLRKDLDYRLERNGEVLFEGKLQSLKHHKEEVNSISAGTECGIILDDEFFEYNTGDVIKCIKTKRIEQQIDWMPSFLQE